MSIDIHMYLSKGYEEEQNLVVAGGADQSEDGDEENKDTYGNHPANDVDAGNNAIAFPPRCHSNEEKAHKLRMDQRAVTHTQTHTQVWTYS